MKVVLDANVIISSLRFGGNPRHVIESINRGDHQGFTSSTCMREIERILLEKFLLLPSEWILIESTLRDICTVIPTPHLPKVPNLRDTYDLHILAAAKISEADFIITGDKDLLTLGKYQGISILSPSDFVESHI